MRDSYLGPFKKKVGLAPSFDTANVHFPKPQQIAKAVRCGPLDPAYRTASSRTLNSSFQRLSVAVLTHHSSNMPSSVILE